MNRADREGVRRVRVDTNASFDAWCAVNHYGFDLLHRGVFGVAGAHESVMAHLRERAPLPGGAR